MSSFRDLAHHRDFTALWVAATISEMGMRVSVFVFPMAAYLLTGSTGWAAGIEAVHLAGLVLALLPAGVLADTVDRRVLMRSSMAASALGYAWLTLAGVAGWLEVGQLLLVAAVVGVAAGVFAPVEASVIRAVVPAEHLATAMSQLEARQHVASVSGSPLGGLLFGMARWLPWLAGAVAHVAGWVLVGRMRADLSAPPPADRAPRRGARAWGDLADGFRHTWSRPLFRVLMFSSPLLNLTLNAVFFVSILRLLEAGFSAFSIGLAEAAMGASGILGALVAPWLIKRIPTGILAAATGWIFVPLTIPLALWVHPIVLAAALVVGIFFNPAGNAGIQAYRLAVTEPEFVGRVTAAMQFTSRLTMPLAPLLAAGLLAWLGGRDAVLVLGGLAAAVALLLTGARSVRTVPTPAHWPGRGAVQAEGR